MLSDKNNQKNKKRSAFFSIIFASLIIIKYNSSKFWKSEFQIHQNNQSINHLIIKQNNIQNKIKK